MSGVVFLFKLCSDQKLGRAHLRSKLTGIGLKLWISKIVGILERSRVLRRLFRIEYCSFSFMWGGVGRFRVLVTSWKGLDFEGCARDCREFKRISL